MTLHIDQIGNYIELDEVPKRLVCLVPSLSELLVDLGLEAKLLGITKFCVHPSSLRKNKTIVGGTKKVRLERIRALAPDLILCNKEENTPEMVAALKDIAPVHVSDVKNLEDFYNLLSQYAKLFDCKDACNQLTKNVKESVSSLKEAVVGRPLLQIGYLIWKDPLMAVGNDTFINAMLRLCGFQNIFATPDFSRYPKIDGSMLSDLEYILLSSEPYPFQEQDQNELEVRHAVKTHLVNGEYFSWYGSRLLKAIPYFQALRSDLESQKL